MNNVKHKMEDSETLTIQTSLAFEKNKQAAILGWCFKDKGFCGQCNRAVKHDWFSSPYIGRIYKALMQFYDRYGRVPKILELYDSRILAEQNFQDRQILDEQVTLAAKMTERYGLDALRDEMTQWMHTVIFFQSMKEASKQYNAEKTVEAWTVVEDAVLLKTTSTFEDGMSQGFKPSVERLEFEKDLRIERSKHKLKYGISFFDDALGGIRQSDVIVIGGPTGRGKTQLAAMIALYNASEITDKDGKVTKEGKRVHYMALEAEDEEIERRFKFSYLSKAYFADENREKKARVTFRRWIDGELEGALDKYVDQTKSDVNKALGKLSTLYRNSGNFGVKELEQHLRKIVHHTDLVVLDHLHYVDTNDQDENASYKKIIKTIRDVALKHKVPIIVIAHIRKSQVTRNPPIVNNIEDFHGTSDVPKIATVCIMMAPKPMRRPKDTDAAMGKAAIPGDKPKYLSPTYLRLCKFRLDSSVCMFTGLLDFNKRTGNYEQKYKLGRLVSGDTEWIPFARPDFPEWAEDENAMEVEAQDLE